MAEVRRRLADAGLSERPCRGGHRAAGRARLSRRRGVRARLGRVAGPRPAAGERALRRELRRKGVDDAIIDGVLDEATEAARRTMPRRRAPGDGPSDVGPRPPRDRLLARQRPCARRGSPIPRARRQRAYALLARNGFDSRSTAAAASREARRAICRTTALRPRCRFARPSVVGYGDNRTRTRGPPPGEPWHRLRAGGASSAASPVPSPSDRRCGVART